MLQFDKAEPLLAEVFEACADQINGVIYTQESVVCAVKLLNLNGRVLRIVFLKIKRQLTRDILCVNNRFHAFVPLIQHRQHAIIHIVVDKHNAFLCLTDTLVDKGISIKNLTIIENALFRLLRNEPANLIVSVPLLPSVGTLVRLKQGTGAWQQRHA